MNKNMGKKLAGLQYAIKQIKSSEIEILFTNAPEGYDLVESIVKSSEMSGCRVLDCLKDHVEQQIDRNASGLYWTTSDIEEAALLRRDFPYPAFAGDASGNPYMGWPEKFSGRWLGTSKS